MLTFLRQVIFLLTRSLTAVFYQNYQIQLMVAFITDANVMSYLGKWSVCWL